MLLEALLAFCFRGLRALLCDAEAMREHLRSSHEEPHNGNGLSPGQGRGGGRAGQEPPRVYGHRRGPRGREVAPMGAGGGAGAFGR